MSYQTEDFGDSMVRFRGAADDIVEHLLDSLQDDEKVAISRSVVRCSTIKRFSWTKAGTFTTFISFLKIPTFLLTGGCHFRRGGVD